MDNNQFNAGLAYSDYKTRKLFYMLAAFVAFAMSSYFVVGYLAGHLRIMEWDGSQWMNGLVAIGITAVMTGYQFILYGAGNVAGGKKATIIAVIVAVSFSLLSEVGQGMERDHIRMETKSQESPTYQAIVGAIGSPTGANPYSTDLQNAEMKLAQCEARLAQGKEKHCEGSAARVEAVNKMIASHAEANQQKALALAATAKTMEKDESNYHPLVNVLREAFSASGTIASFLLSLVLISFFEYAFHYLGGQFAAAREYLMQHGYDVTRQLRQPPRKFDGSISTYSDRGNESAPMAAFTNGANSAKQTVGEYTEYARAQHAREQMAEKTGDVLKTVGDKIESAIKKPEAIELDKPEIKPANMKQSPEQLANTPPIQRMSVSDTIKALVDAVKKSGAKTDADIQAAVFDGYSKLFNPCDLDDKDLLKVAAKIAKNDAPATLPPAMPFHQRNGATGLRNTVLGTAEAVYPLPLQAVPVQSEQHVQATPSTVPVQSLQARTDVQANTVPVQSEQPEAAKLSDAAKQAETDLYPQWLELVQRNEITAGARDAKRFISQATKNGTDEYGLTIQEMQRIWASWQDRAANDGVLVANPKYQAGNRQAKYLLAA